MFADVKQARPYPYTPSITPIREYLLSIQSIRKTTLGSFDAPKQLFHDMEFMQNEGIVSTLPLIIKNPSITIGTPIAFWEQETDYQIRGNIPNIEGHISVSYDGIIQTDKSMVGDHIFCKPIPLPQHDTLSVPTIGFDSVDSTKRANTILTYHYTDRGVVAVRNEFYPIGTILYWGDSELARHNFTPSFGLWNEPGFLIKQPYVSFLETI